MLGEQIVETIKYRRKCYRNSKGEWLPAGFEGKDHGVVDVVTLLKRFRSPRAL